MNLAIMRKINPEVLTVRQIHYLLLEKRRTVRQNRLVHFHRTGRVVPIPGESTSNGEIGNTRSLRSTRGNSFVKAQHVWLDGLLPGTKILAGMGFLAARETLCWQVITMCTVKSSVICIV